MLSALLTLLVISTTLAAPLDTRQFGGSTTENQLSNGQCANGILIYARASTETGNMGPPLCSDLKSGALAICQGVGGPYTAFIGDKIVLLGKSQAAIDEATRLFTLASTQCPNAAIIAGGYSQGTAVIADSVSGLSSTVKNQVKGVVLFGYTKNAQNGGVIPTYPTQNTKMYCSADDGVCGGALTVTAGHFDYTQDIAPAAQFLKIATDRRVRRVAE